MKAMIALFMLSSSRWGMEASEAAPKEQPWAVWFPPSGPVDGWMRTEGPSLFGGEEIFHYMDGAGEIPRSYGFRQLGQAKYVCGEAALEVILFEMEDPAAAYGYFSVRDRDPAEQTAPLQPPARLLPGLELIGWKGRYTFIVRVVQGSVADAVLFQWGRALLENLPDEGQPPELLRYLPHQARVLHSEKYVRGKAAFDAEIKFIPEDVFGLRQGCVEAAAAEYQSGERTPRLTYRLVLLRFPDSRAAAQAFQSFTALQGGAGTGSRRRGASWVEAEAPGQFMGAFQREVFIGLVLEAPDRPQALKILKQFQRFVARSQNQPQRFPTGFQPSADQ